jgi:GxxExxY protein
MEVHKTLGPGFSEIVFKDALEIEFSLNNIPYQRERVYAVDYKGHILPHSFGVDFICYDKIIIEVKAQKKMIEDHYNQTINYLAVSKKRVGLVINFGEKSLAFKRVAL